MNPASPTRRHCTALLLAAALPGCGATRRGWESVATLDPAAAVPERSTGQWRPPLALPGLQLRVWLDNREQWEDDKVVLGGLPAGRDRSLLRTPGATSGRTGVDVWATPQRAGFVFDPRAAVLRVGDRSVRATAGGLSVPFRLRPDGRLSGEPPPALPVDGRPPLPADGQTVRLTLDFDLPAPSPQREDLALDLAGALGVPGGPPLPLILFRPGRWAVGYT